MLCQPLASQKGLYAFALECGFLPRASLVAQTVKNPPAMLETRVQSLGGEDPLARAEGLLFLHGLESNPGSSLQTEEEAGLP